MASTGKKRNRPSMVVLAVSYVFSKAFVVVVRLKKKQTKTKAFKYASGEELDLNH